MAQLAHVRSFRGFVKYIALMNLLKVAMWGGAIGMETLDGVRNNFLIASFFIPFAGGHTRR